VHFLGGTGQNAAFRGLTFLASAADDGTPGNADSYEPSIARSGKAVVFTSTATNLADGDRTPRSDVYRRTIERKFQHLGGSDGAQTLQGRIDLVSATPAGKAGNGPSRHPTVTDDTRYVAFETDASDILFGDTNGVTDIARADMNGRTPKVDWVSWTPLGGIGNRASHDPVISDGGEFVLFDSDATNLRPSEYVRHDENGVKDVFLWNAPTRNVSLESRDAHNGYLSAASQDPATSSRGNYVAFESGTPAGQQIFLRYLGPK
jgi:Tol biopolymer transport system component